MKKKPRRASDNDVNAILSKAPIENLVESFYNAFLEANIRARADAGIKEMVIREALGGCCSWCQKLAGIYEYGTEPKDIFKRHDNCTCIVTFRTEEGYTDVWTNKKFETELEARIAKVEELERKGLLKQELEREIRIAKDEGKSLQFLRKLTAGDGDIAIAVRLKELIMYRLLEYKENNIYISEGLKVKPKEVHNINKRINQCLNILGVPEYTRPDIFVISMEQMGKNVVAAYNYVENRIYIIPQMGRSRDSVMQMTKEFACNDNPIATMLHELIHWRSAMEYKEKYGSIPDKKTYMKYLNKRAKKKLDKEKITSYNGVKISDYAKKEYEKGSFDETLTEYLVDKMLKKE